MREATKRPIVILDVLQRATAQVGESVHGTPQTMWEKKQTCGRMCSGQVRPKRNFLQGNVVRQNIHA